MPTAPARPIVDTFPQVSLSVIRRAYPYLQDRVHRALVDLTPHRLVTILRDLPGGEDFATLSQDDAFPLVGKVFCELIEDPKLVWTVDDAIVGLIRLRFLLWAYEVERQEMYQPEYGDSGAVVYHPVQSPQMSDLTDVPNRPTVRTYRFRARDRRAYARLR